MGKTVVVYKSKSGYTKMYAEWIASELTCDLKENVKLSVNDLMQYDTIIYGGGLYALTINGVSLITSNFEELKGKRIVVWATGSCPGRKEELESLWKHNFSEEQREQIKIFYLRGGFDYTRLNKGDKVLMNLLKLKLKSKKEKTEDEQGLLHAYDVAEYHCTKEKILPLINYIKKGSATL